MKAKMPGTHRVNTQHMNAGDFCCHGACRQGRDCPLDPVKIQDESDDFWSYLFFVLIMSMIVGGAFV